MGHDAPRRVLFRTRPAAPPDASFFEPHELPRRRGRPAAVITKAEERESHRRWSQAALHQRMRGSFTLGEGLGLSGAGVTLGVALSQEGQSGTASYSAAGVRMASPTARGGPAVAAAGPAPAYGAEAGAEQPGAASAMPESFAAPRAPRGTTIIPTTTLPIAPLPGLEARPAGEMPSFALFSALAGLGQIPARAVAEAPAPGPAEVTAQGSQYATVRAAAPRDAGHVELLPAAPASPAAAQATVAEPAAVPTASPPPVEVAKLAAAPVWTAPAWLPAADIMPRPMADRAVAPHAPEAPAVVATVAEDAAHRWTAPTRAAQPTQAEVATHVLRVDPVTETAPPAVARASEVITPVVAAVAGATTGMLDLVLDHVAQATLVDRTSEASRGESAKLALATDAASSLGHGTLAEVVKATPTKAAEEASPAIAATVKGVEAATAALLPSDAGASGSHTLGAVAVGAVKDAVAATTVPVEAGHGDTAVLPAISAAVAGTVQGAIGVATTPVEAGHGVLAAGVPVIGAAVAGAVADAVGAATTPAEAGHGVLAAGVLAIGAAVAGTVTDVVGAAVSPVDALHGVLAAGVLAIGAAVAGTVTDVIGAAVSPVDAVHGVLATGVPAISTAVADAVKDTIGVAVTPAGTGHDGPVATAETGSGGLPAVAAEAPHPTGTNGEAADPGAALHTAVAAVLPAAEAGLGDVPGHGVAGLAVAPLLDHAGSISEPAGLATLPLATGQEVANSLPAAGPGSGDAHVAGGQALVTGTDAVLAGLDPMVGTQPATAAAKALATEAVTVATPAAEPAPADHALPGALATDTTPVEATPHGPAATTEPAPAATTQLEAVPHELAPAVLPALVDHAPIVPVLTAADHPLLVAVPLAAEAPALPAADSPAVPNSGTTSAVDASAHPTADPLVLHLPPAADGLATPVAEAAPLTLFPPPQDDQATALAILHPDLFSAPEPDFSALHPAFHSGAEMTDPHLPTPPLSDFVFA